MNCDVLQACLSDQAFPQPFTDQLRFSADPSVQAIQLAWGAGLIDGDGCVSAVVQRHRNRKTPSIRIRCVAVQNDYHTLHVLRQVLGEQSSLNPIKRQASHNRQAYQLQFDGKHALAVLRKLLPYLVRKREEAIACIRLAVEGQVGVHPGPLGFSPEVHRRRAYWVNRLRRMK